MQPSDEALVAQALALADSAAFETLVRRHQRRVHYLLVRFTREPAVAEELCQETFLRAWRKLASFEARGSFAGWLARLAYNVFLQHRRRQGNRAALTSLDDCHAHELASASDAGSEVPDLERLLGVVSPRERELLVLTYAAGLSAAEIADMLSLAPGTVKSQIHRAKEKIRRHFAIEVAS